MKRVKYTEYIGAPVLPRKMVLSFACSVELANELAKRARGTGLSLSKCIRDLLEAGLQETKE